MFAGPPSAASSAALVRTNLQVDAALNDRSAPVLRPVQWPPAGEGPRAKNRRSAIAEADGNRTRQPTLAGSPVLKFGDGRAASPLARVPAAKERWGPLHTEGGWVDRLGTGGVRRGELRVVR